MKTEHKILFHYIFVQILSIFLYLLTYIIQNNFYLEMMRIFIIVITLFISAKMRIGLKANETYVDKYLKKAMNPKFLLFLFIYMSIYFFLAKDELSIIDMMIYIYSNFICAACFEELLIRGNYYDEFKKKHSILFSAFMCGIIFATFHLPQMILGGHDTILKIISLIFTGTIKGMILCYVTNYTENVFITAIVHFNMGYTNNILGLVISIPIFITAVVNYLMKDSNQSIRDKA